MIPPLTINVVLERQHPHPHDDVMSLVDYCNSFLDQDEHCFDERISPDAYEVTFKTQMSLENAKETFREIFTELVHTENREDNDDDTVFIFPMKVMSASIDGIKFYQAS